MLVLSLGGGNQTARVNNILGGVAVGWPLAARAQQRDQLRRIGIIYAMAETDLEARAWDALFRERLAELGWTDGRNIRVEPLDRRQYGSHKAIRERVGATKPGRACRRNHSSYRSIAAGDPHDPDYLYVRI